MRAFILAGGQGTRLRPTLGDKPKPLAPVAGYPFLTYPILWCRRQGIRDIVLCVGYRAAEVVAAMGGGETWGVRLSYSHEAVPLGTAGALRQAAVTTSSSFLVLNGDTYFDLDLSPFLEEHHRLGGLATLALFHAPGYGRAGCVVLSASGKITSFAEKSGCDGAHPMNGGIYIFEPAALAGVPANAFVSLEQDIFPALAAAGQLNGFLSHGLFADIGTPDSWRSFEVLVRTGAVHDDPSRG